jgi:hypothetical protein
MQMRVRRPSFPGNAGAAEWYSGDGWIGLRARTTVIVRDPVQNRYDRRVTTAIAQLVCLTAMRSLTS